MDELELEEWNHFRKKKERRGCQFFLFIKKTLDLINSLVALNKLKWEKLDHTFNVQVSMKSDGRLSSSLFLMAIQKGVNESYGLG